MSIFKKIRKGKRVLIRQVNFRCMECGEVIELNDEAFNQHKYIDIDDYSSRSSSLVLLCPKCHQDKFRVITEYKWMYRKRCPDCNQMFETYFNYRQKCDKCDHEHLVLLTKLGT